ncbi:substrate-binding domain-containing protein [Ramlibacter sp.]|uniref:molybdate ABC transporter substrate-binding protein n=1 Tax=Ramlibacter sp. TaxID=1917967 RepID=UPI002CF7DD04|nr:substrate-binding domain-containing protein [Ramlibacter sp.]HWI81759.1 substrate-binding domain-containing protein [Ramlibacter sp.]
MSVVNVLSGGAAAAVVKGVQAQFERESGATVNGTFSAVGQMRDQLLAGAPCDLVILTRPLVTKLVESGHVVAGSARSLGLVKTGVAVPAGRPHPKIGNRDELAAAFRAAKAIYYPDPEKATAGIHFMNVLKALGLDQELKAALRPYPNGATAMAEMAKSNEGNVIGCTQETEINYTAGVELAGSLPKEFELATDYTLGICSKAQQPALAQQLAALVAGPASAAIRKQGGFEF